MKKFIWIFTALFLLGVGTLFANGVQIVEDDPFNLENLFITFTAMVLGMPFIVEFFKSIFHPKEGLVTQIFSWVFILLFTFIGWALQLGFLEGLLWWQAGIYGIGVALAANGVFDTGIILAIIEVFIKKKK